MSGQDSVRQVPSAPSQAQDRDRRGVLQQARRVCIFGASLDVDNRGVLALAVSIAGLVCRSAPEAKVAYHYAHRCGGMRRLEAAGGQGAVSVEVLNCRTSPASALDQHVFVLCGLALLYRVGLRGPAERNPWLRSLLQADFIGDITGGDSFSDLYGFRRFLLGSLPLLSVVFLGRPFVMLPQTYGPFRSRASRIVARTLLRAAGQIWTRDKNCIEPVRALCGTAPRYCPDVAFTLHPTEPRTLVIEPERSISDLRPLIGVNVSGLLYMGGYTGDNMFRLRTDYRTLIQKLLVELLERTNANVLLIPHVFGSEQEEEACAAILAGVRHRHSDRICRIAAPLSEGELKWVIGRTEMFVGSRMHACIAALSQCIPAVGLAYSDKFVGVFESAGVADSILDLRHVDDKAVLVAVIRGWHTRHATGADLRSRIPGVRQAVQRSFSELIAPVSADLSARS